MMAPMAASLIASLALLLTQPVAFSLINPITRKRQEDGFLPVLTLVLMMKAPVKVARRTASGDKHMDNFFYFCSIT